MADSEESKSKNNMLVNMDMRDEIAKAERILKDMLASPKTAPKPEILKAAKGLAFLRVTKAGLGLSGRGGTGVVLAKLPDGSWSAPSAIGTAGVSWGIQFGVQVSDFLIVLNTEEAVKAISGGGQLSLGAHVGAAAGPVGAGREGAIAAGESVHAPVFTYSISKGLAVGASLEGSVLIERKVVNEDHYGVTGIRAGQLLSGEIPPKPEAAGLLEALKAIDAVPLPAAEEPPAET